MIEKSLSEGQLFKTKSLYEAQHVEKRILKLTSGANFYYTIAGLNLADANSALQLYLQVNRVII